MTTALDILERQEKSEQATMGYMVAEQNKQLELMDPYGDHKFELLSTHNGWLDTQDLPDETELEEYEFPDWWNVGVNQQKYRDGQYQILLAERENLRYEIGVFLDDTRRELRLAGSWTALNNIERLVYAKQHRWSKELGVRIGLFTILKEHFSATVKRLVIGDNIQHRRYQEFMLNPKCLGIFQKGHTVVAIFNEVNLQKAIQMGFTRKEAVPCK
jgi:hypothetical protein